MRPPQFFKNRKLTFLLLFVALLSGLCWIPLHRHLGSKTEREERGRDQGDQDALYPKKWLEMFMRGRRTRDGRPAAAHRMEAKAHARLMPLARTSGNLLAFGPKPLTPPGPSCDWTEMGPSPEDDSVDSTAYLYGNVSGRVTSLALDLAHDSTGNTLYIGTAYGGLWKTTNGLAATPSYTALSDPTQSLAMGSVALDTSVNPPIIYAGTGELNMAGDSYYGVGILKSADGGGTWSLSSTANSGAISFLGLACSKIEVDPTSPATVMAAMGFSCCHPGLTNLNQGLYRSTDSGATWNQVSTVNGGGQAISGHSFTDIIYDGSTTFYAAVRFQGVYYSTDHGASWTQLPSPFPSGTAPNAPACNTCYSNYARASLASRGTTLWCLVADTNDEPAAPGGGDTGLSQSTDGGHTWTAVALPAGVFGTGTDTQGTYDQYVAAPPGVTALLVGGIDLWRAATVNGNSTSWTNLTNAYVFPGTPSSHPDQHGWAFANAVTWYIGNDGGVWSTKNSGAAFANLNTDLGTIQFYSVSPDPSAAGKFIGGSQDNGTALNHGDSGLGWTLLDGGDGGYTDANPLVLGQFYDENFNIGLFRSDNYGADNFQSTVIDTNYGPISSDNSEILVPYQVLLGSPVSVILGTSRVWKGPGVPSGDGAGWNPIGTYLTGDNNGSILNLEAAPSNSTYIYATTFDGTSTYGVYSNGGGTTWNNVTGTIPTTNPIQGLAIDPTSPATVYVGVQGFVGSGGHVFQSTNNGGSWTDVTGNLPDAPVNSILVDPNFPTDIYVANDVGVFATQNVNGASTSWARLGTALPDSTVLQIKMAESACPRMIVAATHGRGAWSICPLTTYCPPTATPTSTPTVTPTPTITPTPVPAFAALAEPNSTNGQNPIRFVVTLSAPSKIILAIYNVAGEAVYAASSDGATGVNTITWPPRNQDNEPLASGIYFYYIQTNSNKKLGKVFVHH